MATFYRCDHCGADLRKGRFIHCEWKAAWYEGHHMHFCNFNHAGAFLEQMGNVGPFVIDSREIA